MSTSIAERRAAVLVRQEQVLAVLKLVAAVAGLAILFAFEPADVVAPADYVVLPVYVLLAASSTAILIVLRLSGTSQLPAVRVVAMASEVVVTLALGIIHAGVPHAQVLLVLLLLPLAAAVRFGPRGAAAVGSVLLVEPFLRHLVRVQVLGLPSDILDAVALLVPVVAVTALAALLAWSVGSESALAAEALIASERSRRHAEAASHVSKAGLAEVGTDSLEGLAATIAAELGLPSLTLLRLRPLGVYEVVSSYGIRPESYAEGVPVDPEGPLDLMRRTGRSVHHVDHQLTHVRGGRDDTRSEVAVPIVVRDELRGALVVESPDPADHDASVVGALESLATHVGLLFEVQRNFEEQQRKARRYRDLESISHRMITVAGHEFRTPLTSILGFSEVLAEHDQRFDERGRTRLARAILRAAKRLHRLLEDLDRMHTLERGHVLAEMDEIDVAEVMLQAARVGAWPDRVHVLGDDTIVARLDPDLLIEIATKLVDNALQHGEPPVTVRWYVTGSRLHLRVEDHGDGLPDDRVDEMFSPWTQRVDVLSHSHGSGLGLPIARGLAEAMGGELSYDARVAGIAAFELSVPLEREVPAAPPPAPVVALPVQGTGSSPAVVPATEAVPSTSPPSAAELSTGR